MDMNQVAKDNHAFYYCAVGLEMCSELFAQAVYYSFDEPTLYGITGGNQPGYINVDSTDIKNMCTHGSFKDAVRDGILNKVANKIPNSITGILNTKVLIIEDIYRFSFCITKYERNREYGFEIVEDPSSLPTNEQLGRLVNLKITIIE